MSDVSAVVSLICTVIGTIIAVLTFVRSNRPTSAPDHTMSPAPARKAGTLQPSVVVIFIGATLAIVSFLAATAGSDDDFFGTMGGVGGVSAAVGAWRLSAAVKAGRVDGTAASWQALIAFLCALTLALTVRVVVSASV